MKTSLMLPPQAFGGSWTEAKLEILRGYLHAYTTIFNANQKARFFDTFYVDAFAGSGYIKTNDRSLISEPELFEEFEEVESQEFRTELTLAGQFAASRSISCLAGA